MRGVRILAALLLSSSAALSQERTLAVVPLEAKAGVLDAAQAKELDGALLKAAEAALAGHGWKVTAATGDAKAALAEGADAALSGRAASMEGAIVVGLLIQQRGAGAASANGRVVGVGFPRLLEDVPGKVANLVRTGLGVEPQTPTPRQEPGTLRIPKTGAAPAPAQPPAAQAPAPKPAVAPPIQQSTAPAPQTARAEPPPARAEPPPVRAAPPPVQAEPPPLRAEPPSADPMVRLVREVVADLEALRGLRRKQNLKVQILDAEDFSQALKTRARQELTIQAVTRERARWLAFNLAPATVDPAQLLLEVLDEQVAGFYDPFTKALLVRREPPPSAAMGPDGLRLVLAHEVEHALQDQNFGFPDFKTLPDDDARIARLALYEGDAMLAMTVYGARRAGNPPRGAVSAAAQTMRSLDVDTLLKMSGHSPALAAAPAVVREELAMPYTNGFTLVADVWRRGGFPLVDRMFQSPPQSSHQVLHPEAYFAGTLPASLPPPAAPPGMRALIAGKAGELGTRLALEACVDRSVAQELAPGWATDAYTIAIGSDRSIALIWTLQWSEDAGQLANLLKMQAPCWEEQALAGPGPASWTLSPTIKVKLLGNRVAVVRGLPQALQDGALDAALTSKLSAAKVLPPLGKIEETPQVGPARVEAGIFKSPSVGLEGAIPEGYTATPAGEGNEVALVRKGAGMGTLRYLPQRIPADERDVFFQTAASQVAATLAAGAHLAFAGRRQASIAGVDAEERTWTLEGQPLRLHIAIAPWCNGKATLSFVSIESADAARATLEGFARSLKGTARAPACTELE